MMMTTWTLTLETPLTILPAAGRTQLRARLLYSSEPSFVHACFTASFGYLHQTV
jgi:hypothetical protein